MQLPFQHKKNSPKQLGKYWLHYLSKRCANLNHFQRGLRYEAEVCTDVIK
jgi:hypothetical protein